MAGKTISAYTDAHTAESVAYLAKTEHRTPAQIAGMALKFFVNLPPAARNAWCQIDALGDDHDRQRLADEITRTLLNLQYDLAHKQLVSQIDIDSLELESEDDFLAAAVQLTTTDE